MHIASLHSYPVKSCRGIALERALIGDQGVKNDRRFMVTTPDGTFLTQRQLPRMAMIQVSVTDDIVELEAPGAPALRFEAQGSGTPRTVAVWGSPCEVLDLGDDVAAWFSAYLEAPARLVSMAPGYQRPLHDALPREHDGRLLFADAAPLLVTSEASLAELNSRLDEPVPMNRFRPNIVIAGCDPFAEDEWTRFRVGSLEFERLIPCGRCAITTTDQATGARGKEPLATLAGYRKHPDFGVTFGTYFVHLGTGAIAVGEEVVIVG
ncbi:MAG: MOSC N-terminal beta barrel domain-containing protein [Planctomycetota bacterium]